MQFRPLAVATILSLLISACGDDDTAEPTSSLATSATTTSTVTMATTSTVAPTTATTSSSTTTAPAPRAFTVTSDDGDVVLEVPAGAIAEDPGIVILRLQPEEYPEVLAGARELPGTVVYGLEPAGLEFAEPVRISRRIPVANFGETRAHGDSLCRARDHHRRRVGL